MSSDILSEKTSQNYLNIKMKSIILMPKLLLNFNDDIRKNISNNNIVTLTETMGFTFKSFTKAISTRF